MLAILIWNISIFRKLGNWEARRGNRSSPKFTYPKITIKKLEGFWTVGRLILKVICLFKQWFQYSYFCIRLFFCYRLRCFDIFEIWKMALKKIWLNLIKFEKKYIYFKVCNIIIVSKKTSVVSNDSNSVLFFKLRLLII